MVKIRLFSPESFSVDEQRKWVFVISPFLIFLMLFQEILDLWMQDVSAEIEFS